MAKINLTSLPLELARFFKDVKKYSNIIKVDQPQGTGILRGSEFVTYINDYYPLISFNGLEEFSNFHFTIISYKQKYKVNIKPTSSNLSEMSSLDLNIDEIKNTFIEWVNIVQEFQEIVHEANLDPISNHYYNEYNENVFEFEPEDEYKPFSSAQQKFIEQHLQNLEEKLKEDIAKGDLTSEKEAEVKEILEDIEDLKENQSALPKNRVKENLSKIWAKTKKYSGKLANTLIETVIKEAAKELIFNGGIEKLLGM